MAQPFVYHFEDSLPTYEVEQSWDRHQGKPLLQSVINEAEAFVRKSEPFQSLPDRNKLLLLDMAGYMLTRANRCDNRWKENFWGLYVVGSRVEGESEPDSDLDLLSVGSFYGDLSFLGHATRWSGGGGVGIFRDFDLDVPDELPSEYNVGEVDKKYLVRAIPQVGGVLPVDLNVVDLTFYDVTLEDFKETMDLAEDGSQLTRLPLVELTAIEEPPIALRW